jgi:hypothetical protein
MRLLAIAGLLMACEPDVLHRAPEEEPVPPEQTPEPAEIYPVTPVFEIEIPVIEEPADVPEIWCDEEQTVSVQVRPLDVVLIVDNSGSMGEEIAAVQTNINESLAAQIEATGIDYRVIVLSLHGAIDLSAEAEVRSICVTSPLSGTDCNPVPEAPAITERFFHYSVEIGSRDAWCKVLLTLDGRIDDRHALAPAGWEQHVRADSIKSFIVMTDDGVGCVDPDRGWMQDLDSPAMGEQVAMEFDRTLQTDFGELFSEPEGRTYVWHSVVGMDPEADASAGIVEEIAPTAQTAGIGHQALSLLTGGLRFPVSEPERFGDLFRAIADASIETVFERSCD